MGTKAPLSYHPCSERNIVYPNSGEISHTVKKEKVIAAANATGSMSNFGKEKFFMSTNPYIKPHTTAILGGGAQHTVRANPTVSPAGSASGNSRWGKFKSFARKAGAFIKQGLQFINANIIPTVAVVTGFLNAWNKFQGYRTAERVAA